MTTRSDEHVDADCRCTVVPIDQASATFEWVAIIDDKTCPRCKAMHGMQFGAPPAEMPPLHDARRLRPAAPNLLHGAQPIERDTYNPDGAEPETCETCLGRGRVRRRGETDDSWIVEPCASCCPTPPDGERR